MALLEPFNPTIDRYDPRSAARLFRLLWPDAEIAKSMSENLASSIMIAHSAGESCWEVTMFPHGVRLNVGQVETLSLLEGGIWFLFRAPIGIKPPTKYEVRLTDNPFYPSVPIPSGICFVPQDLLPLPEAVRIAHHSYIRGAASYKQSSPFKRSHSPAILDHVESMLGINLPRPAYASNDPAERRVQPLPDELDSVETFTEGARYLIVVNAYERDPRARQLCIAKHGSTCAICDFSFGSVYGRVAEGFIHVHHVRPLSEIGGEYEINPAEDLRPVCPNCHAVLHRQVPAFSIDEVRQFLRQQSQAQQDT